MSTVDLIIQLLKEQKKKQKELTDYLGISKNSFTDWKSGRIKSYLKFLPEIAEFLGVTVDYLLGRSRNVASVTVPVLGSVAAGIPISAVEDILDYEELGMESYNSNYEYFGLKLKGDSMSPRMMDGDVVIVQKRPDADNGDIVIALIDGEDATCKKLKKHENGISLVSYNSAYEPMFFTEKELAEKSVVILGKVVELRAKF